MLPAYAGDSLVLLTTANGTVKGVSKDILGGAVDSSIYVTVTRLNDTLTSYANVVNMENFTDDTYWSLSGGIQSAINFLAGVREVSFDDETGELVLDSVKPPVPGDVYVPSQEWTLPRGLIKNVTHPTTGTKWVNSQIYIPLTNLFDSSSSPIVIRIVGESAPSLIGNYLSAVSWLPYKEPVLYSTIDNDSSLYPAVIRAIPGDTINPFGVDIALNPTEYNVENLTIKVHHDPVSGAQLCGVDFVNNANFYAHNYKYISDTDNFYTVSPYFRVFGVRGSLMGTGNNQVLSNALIAGGAYYGAVAYEHMYMFNVVCMTSKIAFEVGPANYNIAFDNCLATGVRHLLSTGDFVSGVNNPSIILHGNIKEENLRTVLPTKWYNSAGLKDIVDTLNTLRGELNIEYDVDGTPSPTFLRLDGARNLEVNTPSRFLSDSGSTSAYRLFRLADRGWKLVNRMFVSGGMQVVSENTVGRSYVIVAGNRSDAPTSASSAYSGLFYGPSAEPGTLFGRNWADRGFLVFDGSFCKGGVAGTITADSFEIGTSNTIRMSFLPNGNISVPSFPAGGGSDELLVYNTTTGIIGRRTGSSGTVTSVSATDGNGFDFTVTNPTTTPAISLGLQSGYALLNSNSPQSITHAVTFTSTSGLSVSNVGGNATGLNITASNSANYCSINFNTDQGLSGQFVNTGSTYSNAVLGANSTILANYMTSGKLQLAATGSSGSIEFISGGLSAAKVNGKFYPSGSLSIQNGGTYIEKASAIVEISSTTKGFLPPRMTATQASAISSPAEGLMLYVTDTNGTFTTKGWWGWDGAAWQKLNN